MAFKPSPSPEDWRCSPHLHIQPPLASGGRGHVSSFSAGNCHSAWFLWWIFCYASSCGSLSSHWPRCDKVSYCVETSPSLWLPPHERVFIPKILCLPFHLYPLPYLILRRFFFPFCASGILCQWSEVVLWELLQIQMIFWWICKGESGLFSCSSTILGPPPNIGS